MCEKDKAAKTQKWKGDAPFCDFCGEWTAGTTFVDGVTKMGPWALMCEKCFKQFGVRVAPGSGQRYSTDSNKKLEG